MGISATHQNAKQIAVAFRQSMNISPLVGSMAKTPHQDGVQDLINKKERGRASGGDVRQVREEHQRGPLHGKMD